MPYKIWWCRLSPHLIIAFRPPVTHQTIVVLDFGSQFTQLIARRLRELSVYSEILPFNTPLEEIRARQPVGIVLSGGPRSVSEDSAPRCETGVFAAGVPVLGICYGMQLMTDALGGEVAPAPHREFGLATIRIEQGAPMLASIGSELRVWASHGDFVKSAPPVSLSPRPAPTRRSPRWRTRLGGSTRSCSTLKSRTPITARRSCATSRSTSAAAPATGRWRRSCRRRWTRSRRRSATDASSAA